MARQRIAKGESKRLLKESVSCTNRVFIHCFFSLQKTHMSASENSAAIFIDKAGLAFLRDPLGSLQGDPLNSAVPIFVLLFLDALI